MWGVNIQIELNIYNIHKHNTLAVNIKKITQSWKKRKKQTNYHLILQGIYMYTMSKIVFFFIFVLLFSCIVIYICIKRKYVAFKTDYIFTDMPLKKKKSVFPGIAKEQAEYNLQWLTLIYCWIQGNLWHVSRSGYF